MSQQQIAAQRSLKRRNQFRRNLPLYLMLLLPVLLLFIYNYIPMAGIVIAFQKFLPAKGVLAPSGWDCRTSRPCSACPASAAPCATP